MVVTDLLSLFRCKQALASLGLLLLVSLSGCHPAAQSPPQMPPPQVTVAHPVAKEIIDFDEFTARLAAVNSVEIRARVNGYLQKVNFTDGAFVKKGDLLFVIDPRPFQAEVDRVQAELDRARTQVDLATNDYNRAQDLLKTKAISSEESDTRSKNLASANSAVKVAQANLETAKLNLDYTNIAAPIDGRVGRALVREGNLVVGDGNNSTLLTTLVTVDPVYAYADVDETTVEKYQKLDKEGLRKNNNGLVSAQLALGNSNDFSHQGHIDFIDNQIDAKTGTLPTRAVFSNEDHSLIPGQFGRLRIIGSGKYTGMLIPDYAIGVDQEKKVVLVVGADNTVSAKEVVPGQLIDGLRVIRSGLDASDLVVLDRLMMVHAGMKVAPKEEPITTDAASASTVAHP